MTSEKHYGRPMDIEWAKDGDDNQLYIVQARPETVKSRSSANVMERYLLKEKGKVLVEGRAIVQRIGAGTVKIIHIVSEMDKVQSGDVRSEENTYELKSLMRISYAVFCLKNKRYIYINTQMP